jgi:DNA-binding MarR family transcriptional regulator
MKLEDEILQGSFSSEYEKANINVIYTYYWLWDKIKVTLKPYGITPQQFNVLRILRGQKGSPISTSEIRGRMLDKMSDVSRIVDRLCKQGLVSRKICPSDKRLVDVLINNKGLDVLARIDSAQKEMDMAFSALEPDEVKQLNTLLDKARK